MVALSAMACSEDSGDTQSDGDKKECSDSVRCHDNNVEICSDGAWSVQTECKSDETCNAKTGKCDASEVADPSAPGKCTNEALRCLDNNVEICGNGDWTVQTECKSDETCNAKTGQCETNTVVPECEAKAVRCTNEGVESCQNGKWTLTQQCKAAETCNAKTGQCETNTVPPEDKCPDDPNKNEPGICGCGMEDKDIDGDGKIDCKVKVISAVALPNLPDITEKCAEWDVPKHPNIELPNLPEYGYETTIDTKKYGISTVYDVSKAEATTKGFAKAIEDAKKAGFTRIVIPPGHYPIGYVPYDGANFTEGIYMQDGIALIMSDEVTLQMVPSRTYDGNIINLRKRSNVYVEGGHLIGERETHTFSDDKKTDEDMAGFSVYWAHHIYINKTEISKCNGDGILIYDTYYSKADWDKYVTKNIIVANSNIHDNRRQGISVVGADGVRISGNEIHHTKGTSPQFGIDLEGAGRKNANIIIDHNDMHDNAGGDIVNTDTYDLQVEYNTLSCGELNWQSDGLYIPKGNSSQVLYKNTIKKGCNNYNGSLLFFVSYGANMNAEKPNFLIENDFTKTRVHPTQRNRVCMKKNVVHEGMMSGSNVYEYRLIDNKVERYTTSGIRYAFKAVRGSASGNIACSEAEGCFEVTTLNAMKEDEDFNNNLGAF